MWRSFFYAVGIGLFLMGLEGLVLDSVVVQKNGKVQKLIAKIMSDDSPKPAAASPQPNIAASSPNDRQLVQSAANWGNSQQPSYGINTGSRFGPSRFAGPVYGNYGGGRLSEQQRTNPQTLSNNIRSTSPNAQLAAYRGTANAQKTVDSKQLQKFGIREWMPWSLLATGVIIFLYTHSTSRNYNE